MDILNYLRGCIPISQILFEVFSVPLCLNLQIDSCYKGIIPSIGCLIIMMTLCRWLPYSIVISLGARTYLLMTSRDYSHMTSLYLFLTLSSFRNYILSTMLIIQMISRLAFNVPVIYCLTNRPIIKIKNPILLLPIAVNIIIYYQPLPYYIKWSVFIINSIMGNNQLTIVSAMIELLILPYYHSFGLGILCIVLIKRLFNDGEIYFHILQFYIVLEYIGRYIIFAFLFHYLNHHAYKIVNIIYVLLSPVNLEILNTYKSIAFYKLDTWYDRYIKSIPSIMILILLTFIDIL